VTTYLLDVNVLVSLAWPNHIHHKAARRWFGENSASAWATTPVTEAGFVRVSSNRSAIPTAVRPVEAIEVLGRMRALPGHQFVPDDVELVLGVLPAQWLAVATHRLVTDAHLLALADRNNLVLATFDRGIQELSEAGLGLVELIDPS
jgi:uncharacterized protein